MINSNPKSRPTRHRQKRTTPWYGLYHSMISFTMPEVTCLRDLDHAHIDRVIEFRRSWKNNIVKNWGGSWRSSRMQEPEITDEVVKDLHTVCDALLAAEHRRMVSGNTMHVYTNDPELIDRLCQMPCARYPKIMEVELYGQPDQIYLKNPDHCLRSYLRSMKLDDSAARAVKKFLLCQGDIRLSTSLKNWTQTADSKISREYLFFDHDHHSVADMLKLIEPRLIRKTLGIAVHK